MVKKLSEEEIKQKIMMFQLLHKQIEQISEHLETLGQRTQELEISKRALATIGKTEKNTEILAPVANGIFLKASLLDNEKLVVNVGSDVTVEKSIEQVIGLLEEQEQKITEKVAQANELLEQMQVQAMKLYKEVEKYIEE